MTDLDAQEQILLSYLSEVFPLEFFVYHDTLKYKELFSTSKKNEMSRYKRRNSKERLVRRKLAKLKKLRPTIKERRMKKAASHIYRCRLLHAEEVKFLDTCKEVKLFSSGALKKLPHFVERVTGLETLPVLKQPQCLKFLNYIFTILLKFGKKEIGRKSGRSKTIVELADFKR